MKQIRDDPFVIFVESRPSEDAASASAPTNVWGRGDYLKNATCPCVRGVYTAMEDPIKKCLLLHPAILLIAATEHELK